MRVTNKMLSNNFLNDMRNNLNNLQTVQQQMSTQKEINKASDDPTKAARIMQLNTDINSNLQYNTNIKDSSSFLDTTDAALGQCGNVLNRVRDLIVASGNGTYSQQEKNALKDEINTKIGELSQILNTNYDGKYVFGGTRVNAKPLGTLTNQVVSPGTVTKTIGTTGSTSAGVTIDPTVATPLTTTTSFKVTIGGIDAVTGGVNGVSVQASTNGGAFAPLAIVSSNDVAGNVTLDLGNGVKLDIPKDSVNAGGDVFSFNCNALNNNKLIYNSNNLAAPELLTTDPQYTQIATKSSVEISQGVNVQYNVSATDVLQFINDKGNNVDLRQVLTSVINHLDGNKNDGTVTDPNATAALNTQDLQDVTDTINNLLSIRSKVGTTQNRMDSAKDRNITENTNLTDVLSKTEDIDITQKTMDYATAQTVYTAALQTSARIIQPSLLDYLR